MQTLQGIAVSPGIAIGEALIITNEGFRIPRRFVTRDAVDDELQRFHAAIADVAAEIDAQRKRVSLQLGDRYGAIFEAHAQILADPKLGTEIEALIREQQFSPEHAVSRTLRRYAKVLEQFGGPYLAERASDLFDIERSLLHCLTGRPREELNHLASPAIVLAHNLTPGETAKLDRKLVLGFATETGGPSGHTAIVAKGLEIPAVVGTGRFLADVSGGDLVIIDGDLGQVILQPDEETLVRYRSDVERRRSATLQLELLRDLPSETRDGVRVLINANIEFPREAALCLTRGADGIGLYRTEFLYLSSLTDPSEQEHYQAYAQVVEAMQGRPVTIRTLDLGADKMGRLQLSEEEHNPFLGLRSIRLSLRNPDLFRTQLRAILRASNLGKVLLMFPLITTLPELRQAKLLLADAREDLDELQVPYDREIRVGMMVETPASVAMIDQFLLEVDFISIGTNDLTQYTLAVDRSNKEVADLYNTIDPAVLRFILKAVESADRLSVPVSLCGQMSGNPQYTMLLIGMGFRSLSVSPVDIPEIKRVCRRISVDQCCAVARRAMAMDNAREIGIFLREEFRKVTPEFGASYPI